MLGVLMAALVTPQPSPSPLKTISSVRSSPFCTALRENVGHAVKALIENNVAIGQSKSVFLKMAHDELTSGDKQMVMDMDVQHLDPLIEQIVKNRDAALAQLSDAERFAAQPKSDDERRLERIRQQLRAVIDRQNDALNLLSGTFFSYNGNRLNGSGDGLAPGDGGSPVDDPDKDTPLILPASRPASTQQMPQLAGTPVPVATPATIDLGLAGGTDAAALFNALTTYQITELRLENQAAQTILQSTAECR
jgi:hypothetical protein